MSKDKKTYRFIAIALGLTGAYLLISNLAKAKGKVGSKAINTQGTNLEEIKIVIPIKYIVKTSGSALNVREEPNTKSSIVKKYLNGTVINARKSNVEGWHEVLEQGLGSIGYVSSSFIVKK
jgi:hypothetical protein